MHSKDFLAQKVYQTVATPDRRMVTRVVLLPLLLSWLCVLGSHISYLLFHALAELFSIVIALTALVVATTSRHFTRNHFVVFVAVAIGWCAAIDLAHLLVYKGMTLLPVENANPATQLWIAARFLQAAALVVSPLFLRRSLQIGWLHGLAGLAVAATLMSITLGFFPDAYVEDKGLTPFKITAEYVIIGMLAAALALFWRNRSLMTPVLLWSMSAAIAAMMMSEFAFTRYVGVYAEANLIGHVLKIFAYWFVYVALVQTTLNEPFSMLARAASSYDAVPEPTLVVLSNGQIDQANQAAAHFAGLPAEQLPGRSSHSLFHDAAVPPEQCPVCCRIADKESAFSLEIQLARDGRILECSVAPYEAMGERGACVQVVRDITERKRLEAERELLLHNLGERIKELQCLYALSALIEKPDLNVTGLLSGAASILPAAFQYPERASAYIESSMGHFGLQQPAAAASLQRWFEVNQVPTGTVTVYYTSDREGQDTSFLPEEERLMDTVAMRLGEAIAQIQTQARIKRLYYLYEMLSATNRAIVHCRSNEQLLAALFDALIRHSTFPALFIARVGQDDAPFHIVHSHGIEVSRLPHLDEMLSEPHGIFSQLIEQSRQGEVVYCAIPPDASNAWTSYLNAQGLTDWAMLPLLCDGRLWGAVGLYARGDGVFDDEQLRLLNEMASDMAFALNGLLAQERRLAAEQQAILSEHRFREVFESSPAPMQIFSVSSGEMRAINRSLQQWLGYEAVEISTSDQWFELAYADPAVSQQLRELWLQDIDNVRSTSGVAHSPELVLRCKDGSERVAIGTMTVVGDDAVLAWTDMTEIRRNEQALRESEQRFRGMIEQAVFGIHVRRAGKYVYVNPWFCEMAGWSREELVGHEVLDFTLPDAETRQRISAEWARLEAGERSVAYSMPLQRKDGTVIELGLQASAIAWNNEPATIVLTQDITERKRAEERIRNYVKQLERSMKSTLVAVSHMVELRDPYTAGHERRVGLIAGAIARELGWDDQHCQAMEMIGLVHDIGKIAVPAEILSKPSRLLPVEMELIKGHAEAGYEILKDVEFAAPVAETIFQHHERLDGRGYPRGLRGDSIIPEARLLAVADVIESMASHRPYRPALGLDAALAELERNRGTLFDVEIVDAALRLYRDKHYSLPQ